MATNLDSYMPYDAGPGANVTENGWRQFAKYFTGDGIKRGIANGFNTFGDSTGMQVKTDTGECTIQGQWGKSTALKALPIANNTSGANRLDLVVLRNDFVNNDIAVDVLTGSSATVLPALTQNTSIWEVQLAVVTVPNGAVTISSGNVQFIPQVADGWLGGQNRVNSGSSFSSETVLITSPTFALAPNTAYRIIYTLRATGASTSSEWRVNIHLNSAAGTLIAGGDVSPSVGGNISATIQGIYTTTAAENSRFTGTALLHTGTGTAVPSNLGTTIMVEQMGPSSIVTTL